MSDKTSGIPVKRKTPMKMSNKEVSSPVTKENMKNIIVDKSEKEKDSAWEKSNDTDTSEKSDMTPEKDEGKLADEGYSESEETSEDTNVVKDEDGSKEAKYTIPNISYSLSVDNEETLQYYVVLVFLTILSFVTRLYKVDQPAWICWDETHFGKMGSWYINGSFFFDVHPPLGKMMIGLSGYLTGYNGTFPFEKPGDEYHDTNYVGMRVFCACLGACLVPFVYMSTWLLCKSVTAALFAGSFVLFDTGINTLTRYILLDPILMYFIMASTFSLLKFLSYKNQPYSKRWWFWLSVTGIYLACAMGVKFVGLFVVLLVGYSIINDLWTLLGNHNLSLFDVAKHFVARALCLIVLPVICYMIFFAIHFAVLRKSGPGDGFFSSQFQSQLIGNRLHNVSMPDRIAFGSIVSFKQQRTGGGYLHSHPHLYPEEHPPQQQQVTTYSHKDINNMWKINPAFEHNNGSGTPVPLKNGDLVRLMHLLTGRNLHSHREPAPVTLGHFQVSCYGANGSGDANDIFQIVVPGAPDGVPVFAVQSKIKLVHYHVKCAVASDETKLPKWGYEQLEVTCNPNVKDHRTLWSVEEVIDERLPNVSFQVHSPSFLQKFWESHRVMTQGNAGLKPKDGEITSRPWQWPINLRGQFFSGNDYKIYLLGNPIIWYGLLVLMALFVVLYGIHEIRLQRGVKVSSELRTYLDHMFTAGWWAMLGWALHYLPFWPMTRILYFHHYFPALLYSCMIGGMTTDMMIKRFVHCLPSALSLTMYHVCNGLVLSGIAYSFFLFHPLTYGMAEVSADQPESVMYGLKWLDSWEF
ncbi:Protein O-mannosyl-transferase 2 [Mactra antiquata]